MADQFYETDNLQNSITKNTGVIGKTENYLVKSTKQGDKIYSELVNLNFSLQKSLASLEKLTSSNEPFKNSRLYQSSSQLPGNSAIQKIGLELDVPEGGSGLQNKVVSIVAPFAGQGVEKLVTGATAEALGPLAPLAGKAAGALTTEAITALFTNKEDKKKLEEAKGEYFKKSVRAKADDVETQNDSFVQRGLELAANDQYDKAGDDKSKTFLGLVNSIQSTEDKFAKIAGNAYMDEASVGMENYLSFLQNHEDELSDIAAVKGKNQGASVSAMYDAKTQAYVGTLTDKNYIQARERGDSYEMEAIELSYEGFATDIYNGSPAGTAARGRVQRTFNGIAALGAEANGFGTLGTLGTTALENDIEYFSGFISDIKSAESFFKENYIFGDAFTKQIAVEGHTLAAAAIEGNHAAFPSKREEIAQKFDEDRIDTKLYGKDIVTGYEAYWLLKYPEFVKTQNTKTTPYVDGSYKINESENQQETKKTENTFNFSGIQLTIREEADIDKVAQAIFNKLTVADSITTPTN